MLPHDRVVFLDLEPIGGIQFVLRDVVHIRALGALELDVDAVSFSGHAQLPLLSEGRERIAVEASPVNHNFCSSEISGAAKATTSSPAARDVSDVGAARS
jgi:hypothetical protein